MMARFTRWWASETLTGIEDAARASNVLVGAGEYTIDWLDLKDGRELLPVRVPGVVVTAHESTWLVYPRPEPEQSWAAQRLRSTPEHVAPTGEDPLILAGTAETSGPAILAALAGTDGRDTAPDRLLRLRQAVQQLVRVSDQMRAAGDTQAPRVTALAENARQLVGEFTDTRDVS